MIQTKKSMQKWTALCVAAMLGMFCLLPGLAFAAPDVVFTVGNAQGRAGDEVTVIVHIADNPGHTAAVLTVNYDNSILELRDITALSVLSGSTFTRDLSINNNFAVMNITPSGIDGNGDYVALVFGIRSTAAPGTTTVSLAVKDDISMNFIDSSYIALPASFNSGTITVLAPPTDPGTDPGTNPGTNPGNNGGSNSGGSGTTRPGNTTGTGGTNSSNNTGTSTNPPDQNATTDNNAATQNSDTVGTNNQNGTQPGNSTAINDNNTPLTDGQSQGGDQGGSYWWVLIALVLVIIVVLLFIFWRRRKAAD